VTLRFAHVGSLGTCAHLAGAGDIGLFHAPLVASDASYARNCGEISRRKFTILDCAALEVAIGTETCEAPLRDVLEMSREFEMSEVVCPDTPCEPASSLARSLEFIAMWKRVPLSARRPRIMVVPHALTVTGWLAAAERMIRHAGHCTVGIPRLFAKRCGGDNPRFRVSLASRLRKAFPRLQVHLLGAGENFLDELSCVAASDMVRSIDSTFIHRYAISGADPTMEYAKPVPLRDTTSPRSLEQRTSELSGVLRNAMNTHG
jgi:hypothetical protein